MKKVFRLFISSTFDDFKLERAVLQKYIFPEIKKAANEKGISFLPIDLRWGVPEESQIDQRTMDICLSEVERATTEPHPDFLILSGDKYGWVPLPRVIEKKEFEDIVAKLKELKNKNANINTNILETWYELDYNQLPTSYILKSRDEVTDKDYTNWDNWKVIEDEIRRLLQLAVSELNFDEKTKEKYFISATHQELKTFLKHENSDKELKSHLIGFIRKFNDLPEKLFDKQEDNIKRLRGEIVTNTLKDNLKILDVTAKFYEKAFEENEKCKNLLKKCEEKYCSNYKNEDFESCMKKHCNDYYEKCFIENIFEDINSLEEIEEKLEAKDFAKYLIEFGNFVKERLLESLENIEVENFTEKDYQEDYKNYLLSRPFVGREKEIEEILNAIENNNKVLIYGESGIGKSAIMAQIIKRLEEKNKDVVYRFCGVTNESSNLISMLNTILDEIGIEKVDEQNDIDLNYLNEEENKFKKLLVKIQSKFDLIDKEIIIIIDAIDQLGTASVDDLEWLPNNKNIKIIISTLKDEKYEIDSQYFSKLQFFDFYKIKINRIKNSKKVLEKLLEQENRTLTYKQFEYVMDRKDSNKPLFLTVAKEEVKYWRSSDEITNKKEKENKRYKYLASTQTEIIEEFIENLYILHHIPKELVNRVFGYIVASQEHLSEDLLLEVLSKDEELMKSINNQYHKNLTGELPPAVWSRFRWMIKNYIKEDKNEYIKFYHREFSNIKIFKKIKFINDLMLILEKDLQKKYFIVHMHTLANKKIKNFLLKSFYNKKFFFKLSFKEKIVYLNNIEKYLDVYMYSYSANIDKYFEIINELIKYTLKKEKRKELYLILGKNLLKMSEFISVFNEKEEIKYLKQALKILKKIYIESPKDENISFIYAQALRNKLTNKYILFKLYYKEAKLLYKISLRLYKLNQTKYLRLYLDTLNILKNFDVKFWLKEYCLIEFINNDELFIIFLIKFFREILLKRCPFHSNEIEFLLNHLLFRAFNKLKTKIDVFYIYEIAFFYYIVEGYDINEELKEKFLKAFLEELNKKKKEYKNNYKKYLEIVKKEFLVLLYLEENPWVDSYLEVMKIIHENYKNGVTNWQTLYFSKFYIFNYFISLIYLFYIKISTKKLIKMYFIEEVKSFQLKMLYLSTFYMSFLKWFNCEEDNNELDEVIISGLWIKEKKNELILRYLTIFLIYFIIIITFAIPGLYLLKELLISLMN